MPNKPERPRNPEVKLATDRIAREEAIHAHYGRRPSLRELYESGEIDRDSYEKAVRLREEGPPQRPSRELIAALRAERERQSLSLADVAKRSGMDRAAIHKLEIGLNKNPTLATLARYAEALGKRIGWNLEDDPGHAPRTVPEPLSTPG